MSSKGVGATCLDASGDTRQVTTTGPVPQIENIKLSGSQRELRVGCWDHVTRLPCITGFLTAGGEPRPPGLEFFSKWLLFASPPHPPPRVEDVGSVPPFSPLSSYRAVSLLRLLKALARGAAEVAPLLPP